MIDFKKDEMHFLFTLGWSQRAVRIKPRLDTLTFSQDNLKLRRNRSLQILEMEEGKGAYSLYMGPAHHNMLL